MFQMIPPLVKEMHIVCAIKHLLFVSLFSLTASMVDLAGNANEAPTTASATLHMQGRKSFAKLPTVWFCKGLPSLHM